MGFFRRLLGISEKQAHGPKQYVPASQPVPNPNVHSVARINFGGPLPPDVLEGAHDMHGQSVGGYTTTVGKSKIPLRAAVLGMDIASVPDDNPEFDGSADAWVGQRLVETIPDLLKQKLSEHEVQPFADMEILAGLVTQLAQKVPKDKAGPNLLPVIGILADTLMPVDDREADLGYRRESRLSGLPLLLHRAIPVRQNTGAVCDNVEDVFPTAPEILSNPNRVVGKDLERRRIIRHEMEPILAAVGLTRAALAHAGVQHFEIFPSLGLRHESDGGVEQTLVIPLVAAINMSSKENMLTLFGTQRIGPLPAISSVVLMSDVASAAMVHILKAADRARIMIIESVVASREGRALPGEKIDQHLEGIADELAQAHYLWPNEYGNDDDSAPRFISEVVGLTAGGAGGVTALTNPRGAEAIANRIALGLMYHLNGKIMERGEVPNVYV